MEAVKSERPAARPYGEGTGFNRIFDLELTEKLFNSEAGQSSRRGRRSHRHRSRTRCPVGMDYGRQPASPRLAGARVR